ncbi:hypothetical protein EYF80_057220 [Liparis tanakae]|uniref:Uncharacterized protein n=1 Tax=Liparis tanakae TaxID=230148 RepID=A0A4Z2EUW5_9TELE|nr:hypothetical protein EYF80_057220 [Liparis tanakae]
MAFSRSWLLLKKMSPAASRSFRRKPVSPGEVELAEGFQRLPLPAAVPGVRQQLQPVLAVDDALGLVGTLTPIQPAQASGCSELAWQRGEVQFVDGSSSHNKDLAADGQQQGPFVAAFPKVQLVLLDVVLTQLQQHRHEVHLVGLSHGPVGQVLVLLADVQRSLVALCRPPEVTHASQRHAAHVEGHPCVKSNIFMK